MATMNVSLPDEMREWVEQQAKSGRYANASDYVRDLIRHDQDARAAGGWTDEELRAEIRLGLDEVNAGRLRPSEEALAEVSRRVRDVAAKK